MSLPIKPIPLRFSPEPRVVPIVPPQRTILDYEDIIGVLENEVNNAIVYKRRLINKIKEMRNGYNSNMTPYKLLSDLKSKQLISRNHRLLSERVNNPKPSFHPSYISSSPLARLIKNMERRANRETNI